MYPFWLDVGVRAELLGLVAGHDGDGAVAMSTTPRVKLQLPMTHQLILETFFKKICYYPAIRLEFSFGSILICVQNFVNMINGPGFFSTTDPCKLINNGLQCLFPIIDQRLGVQIQRPIQVLGNGGIV